MSRFLDDQHNGHGSRRGLSGGDVLAELCRAEARSAGLDQDQFEDLVHARGEQWCAPLQQREGVSADRRRRVLAHPDLAKRLQSLLGLADAKHWNGYVPPRVDAFDCINTSSIRAALIVICREAHEREMNDRSASA